jgi:DNA (cytosine-5)-methyltransferase 1
MTTSVKRTSAPRLLDTYCKAGGCSAGYARAGFEVVGIDINPQPNYPYEFIQADALEVLADTAFLDTFDVVAASPPCQASSALGALSPHKTYPQLIPPTRELLMAWGGPYVIENVMPAPLLKRESIVLCGGMFGLRTYRHRRFELSPDLQGVVTAPAHPKHVIRTATKRRKELWNQGWHVSITGDVGVYVGPEAMGIDWMTGDELSEAIPPAYTAHIGDQLIRVLTGVAA